MYDLFLVTVIDYSIAVLPWFAGGTVVAFFLEKKFNHRFIKKYFGSNGYGQLFLAQVLGMISPLSIMSFLPLARELVVFGANPAMIFSFFIAERAYDLQSFFLITSLFGMKFAILNALAILVALLAASLVLRREKIKFVYKETGISHNFWTRQTKLGLIVIFGIVVGALLRSIIPAELFSDITGDTLGGMIGGFILGFSLYFGPILANYPVAKAFADLGMSQPGVFTFLTVSPVFNLVVIMLFVGVAGLRSTLKAFTVYMLVALAMCVAVIPLLD